MYRYYIEVIQYAKDCPCSREYNSISTMTHAHTLVSMYVYTITKTYATAHNCDFHQVFPLQRSNAGDEGEPGESVGVPDSTICSGDLDNEKT